MDSVYILILAVAMITTISAAMDCKLACRTCNQNKAHPELLEVYCGMCKECKLRRRERMRATASEAEYSTTIRYRPTIRHKAMKRTTSPVPMLRENEEGHKEGFEEGHEGGFEEGHEGGFEEEPVNQEEEIEEEECPTPPPCSSEDEMIQMKHDSKKPSKKRPTTTKTTPTTTTTTTTTSTTTSTTTERPKCPPIERHCRKKKTTKTPVPLMPMPCMPCMPMCMTPCPLQQPQPAMTALTFITEAPQTTTTEFPQTSTIQAPQTPTDYVYVYVGVPKSLVINKA